RLPTPPAAQPRMPKGLEHAIPFHAIDDGPRPAASWAARCEYLLRKAMAEASVGDTTSPLYIASSSLNIGAIEADEAHPPTASGFLRELAKMLDWRGPVYWINTACT